MAWGTVDVGEQRMRFVVLASRREKSMQELCAEFAISRPTGYEWLRHYERGGVAGVAEKSRRPQHIFQQTAKEIAQRVVELRRQRPDWGAKKLRVLLQREGLVVPRITIHRILLRHGLVRPEDRHRAAVQWFQRGAPNELWQMDFKGSSGWNAVTGPLSVLDDHSRYAITLAETGSTRAEAVRERLEEAFQRCGVPDGILMDHGTPWWNMQAAAGWTWLTVWLMKQGMKLHFSGYRHPQTQGKVERFHGSLEAARRKRDRSESESEQQWYDAFRQEYNDERPHEALGMKTPSSVWRPSARRYQAQPAAWEYSSGAEVRRLGAAGQIQVQGRRWDISKALAGEWVQLVRIGERILVYYCRSVVRELDPTQQKSTAMSRWQGGSGPDPDLKKCKGCYETAV
jgi:transposase InsO family protein